MNFKKEVLESNHLVLVDFWAPWCRYCVMLEPTLQELSKKFPNLKIVKVNVDETPEIAQEYSVMSLPTLILFKAGKELDEDIVDRSFESLSSVIAKYI